MKKTRKTTKTSITVENKLQLGLSVIAILISAIALWQSLATQSQLSSPNIQLLTATITDYDLQHESDVFLESNHYITIIGIIQLKNYGNTPVQLIDVDGQSLSLVGEEKNTEIQEMLLVSDHETFVTDLRFAVRTLDEIHNAEKSFLGKILRTINPKEEKTLFFLFRTVGPDIYVVDKTQLQNMLGFPIVKLFLTFSNGQEVSIIPEYSEQQQ